MTQGGTVENGKLGVRVRGTDPTTVTTAQARALGTCYKHRKTCRGHGGHPGHALYFVGAPFEMAEQKLLQMFKERAKATALQLPCNCLATALQLPCNCLKLRFGVLQLPGLWTRHQVLAI